VTAVGVFLLVPIQGRICDTSSILQNLCLWYVFHMHLKIERHSGSLWRLPSAHPFLWKVQCCTWPHLLLGMDL
jgi:hypothetical protein